MSEFTDQQKRATRVLASPAAESESPLSREGLLLNRNVVLLASGQAISSIGDYLYSATLPVWVLALTSSVTAVSGVSVAQFLPAFLIGPLAGIFVDRWNRRHVLLIAACAQAFCTIIPLLPLGPLQLPAIYTSTFCLYAFASFTTPAIPAVLQAVVHKRRLAQATSLSQTAGSLAMILGLALGTPLFAHVGPAPALLINAATFLVSALGFWLLRAPKEALHPYAFQSTHATARSLGGTIRDLGADLLAGFRYVITTPVLQRLALVPIIAALGFGSLNSIEVIFLRDRLHVSPVLTGPLSAALGVGTLLGAISAGLLAKRLPRVTLLAGTIFLLGIGTIIYAFQTTFLAALLIYGAMGILEGCLLVIYLTLLLTLIPKQFVGRVVSAIQMGASAMLVISAAGAGLLGQILPVHLIFAASGLLITFAGLVVWLALRHLSGTFPPSIDDPSRRKLRD